MDHLSAIKLFGALFAIMNPAVNLPVFLGLTEGANAALKRRLALKAGFYSGIMAAVIAVAGGGILTLFGITLDDFRVAGGLVLMTIALNMLHGTPSTSHHGTEDENAEVGAADTVAFYPMTFPLIIGPGSITTLILFSGRIQSPLDAATFAAVVALILGLLTLTLYFSATLGRILSTTAQAIVSRLMGMILAAIAVDMMAAGLRSLLPGLAG